MFDVATDVWAPFITGHFLALWVLLWSMSFSCHEIVKGVIGEPICSLRTCCRRPSCALDAGRG
jgi:hypothetical protein